MKDYFGHLTMDGFSFSGFHFMALFWKASLLNYNRSIGCYLEHLPFPRIVSSFIILVIYLLLHPTYKVRRPSQISKLDHHTNLSVDTSTATYKLYTKASCLTISSKTVMIIVPSWWDY